MSEPIDYNEVAHQVVGQFEFAHTKLSVVEFHQLTEAVVAALKGERERCADIAEGLGVLEAMAGEEGSAAMVRALDRHGGLIAASIRGEK
jgi:hypothetical protein